MARLKSSPVPFFMVLSLAFILALAAGCATMPSQGGTPTPTPTATPPLTTTAIVTATPTPMVDQASCTVNSDCVPAQCCHPTSCINRAFKGVCNVACTASCEGPIDCGAGHRGCVSGTCRVVPNPTPTGTTPTPRGGYSH